MNKSRRFTVHVHPAGLWMLAAAFLFFPSREVLSAVLALLWHECAHAAMMLMCRVSRCHIELTPFGGMADAKDFQLLSPIKQMLIAASGVVASAVGAWGCVACLSHTDIGFSLFQNHLSLAFVNSLPAWPLDGARVLIALAAAFGKENAMRKCLSVFSYTLGGAMVLLGLYSAWKGQINPSLLCAGPYLWYAVHEGNVAERLKRLQHCHQKLRSMEILPLEAFVSSRDVSHILPGLLGRISSSRYQILIQLDERGRFQRLWTEQEMLDDALESIDTAKK